MAEYYSLLASDKLTRGILSHAKSGKLSAVFRLGSNSKLIAPLWWEGPENTFILSMFFSRQLKCLHLLILLILCSRNLHNLLKMNDSWSACCQRQGFSVNWKSWAIEIFCVLCFILFGLESTSNKKGILGHCALHRNSEARRFHYKCLFFSIPPLHINSVLPAK